MTAPRALVLAYLRAELARKGGVEFYLSPNLRADETGLPAQRLTLELRHLANGHPAQGLVVRVVPDRAFHVRRVSPAKSNQNPDPATGGQDRHLTDGPASSP